GFLYNRKINIFVDSIRMQHVAYSEPPIIFLYNFYHFLGFFLSLKIHKIFFGFQKKFKKIPTLSKLRVKFYEIFTLNFLDYFEIRKFLARITMQLILTS